MADEMMRHAGHHNATCRLPALSALKFHMGECEAKEPRSDRMCAPQLDSLIQSGFGKLSE